jgi:hypothetical protein
MVTNQTSWFTQILVNFETHAHVGIKATNQPTNTKEYEEMLVFGEAAKNIFGYAFSLVKIHSLTYV